MSGVENEYKASALQDASQNIRNSSFKNFNDRNVVCADKTYRMGMYEIHAALSNGMPYTARQLSKALFMPIQELECILKLMVRLGEIERDEQALTYYILKGE